MTPSELTIADHPDRNRFEAHISGEPAGHLDYTKFDEIIEFPHTEVDPGFAGRGIGSALVRTALDAARAANLGVLPSCPFVRDWIDAHPDYRDLLAK